MICANLFHINNNIFLGLTFLNNRWIDMPIESGYVNATMVDGFGKITLERVLRFEGSNDAFTLIVPVADASGPQLVSGIENT